MYHKQKNLSTPGSGNQTGIDLLYLLLGVLLWFLVGGATPLKGLPLAESKKHQNAPFL